jgi:hypothetical protein
MILQLNFVNPITFSFIFSPYLAFTAQKALSRQLEIQANWSKKRRLTFAEYTLRLSERIV